MVDESSFPLSIRQVLKKNHENKGFAPKVTVVTSSFHKPSASKKMSVLKFPDMLCPQNANTNWFNFGIYTVTRVGSTA